MTEQLMMTTVLAESKQPFARMRTRYDYLMSYFPMWKNHLRFRTAMYMCALLGGAMLFIEPLASPFLLAGAAYFHERMQQARTLIESGRMVMIGN